MKRLLFICGVFLFSVVIAQDKKPLPKNHCLGISKRTGDSCRTVPKEGKYCRWHDPDAIHCAHKDCGMLVAHKGEYCIYHLK